MHDHEVNETASTWSNRARYGWLVVGLALAACSSDTSAASLEASNPDTSVQAEPRAESTMDERATIQDSVDDLDTTSRADLVALPTREGPRRETTHNVPHVQTDAVLVPEVDAELRRRLFSLPGIENRESEVSLAGARSLWLADDMQLARPEVLQAGREIAHIHPNGSLHVWLPVERAIEATETKWGELHPWVGDKNFWDGLTMIYTPETLDEVDITMLLVVDAYNYITGENLDPADYG